MSGESRKETTSKFQGLEHTGRVEKGGRRTRDQQRKAKHEEGFTLYTNVLSEVVYFVPVPRRGLQLLYYKFSLNGTTNSLSLAKDNLVCLGHHFNSRS